MARIKGITVMLLQKQKTGEDVSASWGYLPAEE